MTPAIPLLTGWICIAMLFTVFPARRWTPGAAVLAAVLVVLCAVGVAADQPWQLLAFGCTAMAASAVVGARMAQDADSADARARVVADFIAGMTDRYAGREHERLTGQQLLR